MAIYEYKVVAGFDDSASLVNVEDITSGVPPRGVRLPLGGTVRTTMDGTRYVDGAQVIQWVFESLSQTDFDALVTAIFTDYDTPSADVTIRTKLRDNTYANKNAIAYLPLDYSHQWDYEMDNVVFEFYVIGDAT